MIFKNYNDTGYDVEVLRHYDIKREMTFWRVNCINGDGWLAYQFGADISDYVWDFSHNEVHSHIKRFIEIEEARLRNEKTN